ncbi:MAG TPA: hypothetical protein VGP66_03335 [Candidatus Acidoferrum sp.]|jgi:hypothetical protein|nr:hypothetical protein [Candidatus Acidoferrum sp.]
MAGWRLVAILRIIHNPFSDHKEAAHWYAEQGCQPPSNCLVPGNPPKTFNQTHQKLPNEVRRRASGEADSVKTRLWDCTYWERAKKQSVFLAAQAEYLELNKPPQLQKSDMIRIFGKVPCTQTPPKVDCDQFQILFEIATKKEMCS